MSNDKQSSVIHFSRKAHELFEMYSEGKITRINLNISMTKLTQECQAMHKDEIINATIYGDRFEGCYGLDSEQYYNETFGGNNEQR